jgi:hypothetical protein
MPAYVFMDPTSRKHRRQMEARTTLKGQKLRSVDIFVIPKTEVTNFKGRKKMLTRVRRWMLNP